MRDEVGGDVAREIGNYMPTGIPPAQWKKIRGFVRAAVWETATSVYMTSRVRLQATSQLAAWCVFTAGYQLTREVVFNPQTIAEFIQAGQHRFKPTSLGVYYGLLRGMSARLLGKDPGESLLPPLPASPVSAPYTIEEIVEFCELADYAPTILQRESILILLSLGFGAGLRAGEILTLRYRDLYTDPSGVLWAHITATARPRWVPLLPDWSEWLTQQVGKRAPDSLMFRPHAKRRTGTDDTSKVISQFFDYTGITCHPTCRRMRNTWLVSHLSQHTPREQLLIWAGIFTSKSTLSRLSQYMDSGPEERDRVRRCLAREVSPW